MKEKSGMFKDHKNTFEISLLAVSLCVLVIEALSSRSHPCANVILKCSIAHLNHALNIGPMFAFDTNNSVGFASWCRRQLLRQLWC